MKNQYTATIGIFDGVHRGHQKILKKLTSEASRNNLKTLLITFYPHPRQVLTGSKARLLISLKHRLKLIKDSGIDVLNVIRFTKSLARMTPDTFIKKILIDKFRIKILIVGENFLFGSNGKGNLALLKKASKRYNFKLFSITSLKSKNSVISSTRIRYAIEKGDLKNASLMLGRPVIVLGTVVKGRRIGRSLGFPTANIDPHHEIVPPSGVYAVDVNINRKRYKGILNIGTRPTFCSPRTTRFTRMRGRAIDPTIELHIFNFKRNIYGKDVEIIFKRKMRDEKTFKSIEALRKQIQNDIRKIILSKPHSKF